jgi:mono/diheme cytochrome c family protein
MRTHVHFARALGLTLLGLLGTGAPAAVAGEADDGPLAKQAQEVLKANCYRCHGANGTAEGGLNYVLDRQQLVVRKKLVPGDAKKSRLYRRVQEGEMPPEGEKPRPSERDLTLLRQWIESGAADFDPPRPKRTVAAPAEIVQAIAEDLDTLGERDRRFARYFTLTHLHGADLKDDQLQTYRHALAKLVNSLSWGRKVVVPVAVGPERSILRIDLRDYKWNEKVWQAILARYPYGVLYDTEAARYVRAATHCDLPYVRGDWFVTVAATPPLYQQILQLPESERELENLLRLDADDDIRSDRVARAGFNGSGISRNNRVIERHDAAYGAYWRSYDFSGNAGIQNLFTNPLGPGDGDAAFRHDGGEIIFNLPNGLQAYFLVDGKGNRIDRAPVGIVSDPKRPDRTVENGLSCMSCHARGLIDKADQVRGHVLKNPKAFGKSEADAILAIYVPREKFQALVREDSQRFREALAKTGSPATATEPIVALALRFEAELDLPLAAAEAGLEPEEFQKRFSASPALARTLGPLAVAGGTLQRQVFLDGFADMVTELRLGTPYQFNGDKPAPPPGLVVRADLVDGKHVRGTLGNSSIPIRAAEGDLDIQANKVLTLQFGGDNDVLSTTREVITGKIQVTEFRIKTDRGTFTLKRDQVRGLAAADSAPPIPATRKPD